jgi:uncharacterized membrane protein
MTQQTFPEAGEHELERASNAYIMSLVVIISGIPLPVLNLIASIIYYFGNRSSTYFVRWHCMQLVLSQFSIMILNSITFSWFIDMLISKKLDTNFFYWLAFALLVNLIELIGSIYAAVQVRKGIHVRWFGYAALCDILVRR